VTSRWWCAPDRMYPAGRSQTRRTHRKPLAGQRCARVLVAA